MLETAQEFCHFWGTNALRHDDVLDFVFLFFFFFPQKAFRLPPICMIDFVPL